MSGVRCARPELGGRRESGLQPMGLRGMDVPRKGTATCPTLSRKAAYGPRHRRLKNTAVH